MKKKKIEDKWYIYPRILQTQEIIYFSHVNVGSHFSKSIPLNKYLNLEIRKNIDSDISEMIYRWEICGTRGSKPRNNINIKHKDFHKTFKRYHTDTVFLSDYLAKNTGQRYLLKIVDRFSKFGYAILIYIKTKIRYCHLRKNS